MGKREDDFDFLDIEGFDWDEANKEKSWKKHKVFYKESEQVFFNLPRLTNFDKDHSIKEKRYQCLGKTDNERKLFISFTIRNKKIRVISARDQNKKERNQYEKTEKI